MSNRNPYRVAIIGTGGIANSHMDALRAAGDRVQVGLGKFGEFLGSVHGFLEPTERFFVRRYPSLRA